MSVFSHIVCCINLSENPDDIAQYVNDVVKQNNSKLIIVHVSTNREEIVRRSSSILEDLIKENQKQNEAVFVEYVKKHFESEPDIVLTEGNIEIELLHVIDKYCADLVVIGSMSTKGIFGSWFNRAPESIIGKTRIPVLVIPNDLSLECTPDF